MELVTAAFSCPVCLRVDCAGQLSGSADDTVVECECRNCETRWIVGVDGWQEMRLILSPPPRYGDGWHLELEPAPQR